jgi:glycosyltransferase involved in cell wall biosynthesis
MTHTPKVSVLCLTYNQKEYIKECLDSILMQKTNFAFEVLINDDASTDGTKDIIQEYQKKYPGVVKPIFHKQNQYSLGKRNFMIRYLLPVAQGEYVAICEGDDYWTDPSKLQKQVDFLDNNSEYAVCFHKVKVVYENKEKTDQIYPDVENKRWYTHRELFKLNYIQTNSVIYRKRPTYKNVPTDATPGDWFLHLYHASFGKIKLIDEVMSVYRKHEGGMWWDYDRDRENLWRRHGVAHLAMWVNLYEIYAKKPVYITIIKRHIQDMVNTLVHLDAKFGDKNLLIVLERYPREVYAALEAQAKDLSATKQEADELNNHLEFKEREVADLIAQLNAKEQELLYIKSTKTWRLRHSVGQSAKRAGIRKNGKH